jgi:hypothetical protein
MKQCAECSLHSTGRLPSAGGVGWTGVVTTDGLGTHQGVEASCRRCDAVMRLLCGNHRRLVHAMLLLLALLLNAGTLYARCNPVVSNLPTDRSEVLCPRLLRVEDDTRALSQQRCHRTEGPAAVGAKVQAMLVPCRRKRTCAP